MTESKDTTSNSELGKTVSSRDDDYRSQIDSMTEETNAEDPNGENEDTKHDTKLGDSDDE